MNGYNLYFGCAHTQFHAKRHLQFRNGFPYGAATWEEFVEQAFDFAADYLDFFPAVYYPAYTYHPSGDFVVESVGMKEEFAAEWAAFKEISARHNDPGTLVTFAGYEWTGDRRRWGDHNVIYFDEDDAPLDLAWNVEDLFGNLRARRAFAVPHHTGYAVGERGKDWDHHDPALSPVVEIYSTHGSSEANGTPFDLRRNTAMSPRVSGGTIQDGLERGHRFGIIASGDNGGGFPGRWGRGLAAVWATDLSREGIWNAITNRRTYGITGDRIRLEFFANGEPMGAEIAAVGDVRLFGTVEASDALDRIELLRDGQVIRTQCHRGKWSGEITGEQDVKVRVELGWGPRGDKGVGFPEKAWRGRLRVHDGEIRHVEKCFTRGGQQITTDGCTCGWTLTTGETATAYPDNECQQAMVFTIHGAPDTVVELESEGTGERYTLRDLCRGSRVLVHPEEARAVVAEKYGLTEYENQGDKEFQNAFKTLIHRGVPDGGYRVPFAFVDHTPPGTHYYYLRVSQENGQMAWSSPVWVSR
jgi:hypothetical protein